MDPDRTVLIDFDQVIADLHGEWITRYNLVKGTQLTPEDCREWDFPNQTGDPTTMWALLHDNDLYDYVEPWPGAIEGLHELSELKIDWLIVTSCVGLPMIEGKVRWLRRHGLAPRHGWPRHLVPFSHKHLLRGAVLLDDRPANVQAWMKANPGRPGLLFDQPYNRELMVPAPTRIHNWDEAVDAILHALNDPLVPGTQGQLVRDPAQIDWEQEIEKAG